MSKRNIETLKSFFNRCAQRVHGFDPTTIKVRGLESVLNGQILAKRGDVYLCAEVNDENAIQYSWIAFEGDGEGETVDRETARWLLARARRAKAEAEDRRKEYEGSRAAMLTICGGECTPEVKEKAAAQERYDRDRAFEAEAEAKTEARCLGEYLATCKWGTSGNVFVGRRRVSWDGHDRTRLVIQGRTVVTVTTDRNGRIDPVKVFTKDEAEENFQADRTARREAEAAYNAALAEARALVEAWKRGENAENAEFEFYNGQMGGRLEFEIDGLRAQVSAHGAGIEAGFDPECPSYATAASLRAWEIEAELEGAVERAGLWRCPAPEDRKVRVKGEWFGCERPLTVGDDIGGVGQVVAIALPR
jgi:hypothetical protein